MYRRVLAILPIVALASQANAAILGFMWSPGQGATGSTLNLGPNGVATMEVQVTLLAGDNLNAIWFEYDANPNVEQTGRETSVPDWSVGGQDGVLGAPGTQFAAAAITDFETTNLNGPGTFVVGTVELQLLGGTPSALEEIAFTTTLDPHVQLISTTTTPGGDYVPRPYTYDARYSGAYSGYYSFGKGSPGIAGPQGQPRDPLFIHVPEPVSAVLFLLLGGLAGIGRRHVRRTGTSSGCS